MLTTHNLRRLQTGAIALVLLVGMASTADARVFRMTGNWKQDVSAQLQIPIFGGINHAPAARVSAQGSAPADLTIPVAAFKGDNSFIFALPKTTIVQISTMFSFSGPGTAGVMSSGPKGSRPVNFSFCPGAAANPACTSTGIINPTQGTHHGKVGYTAGSNQFGGTMQMLTGGIGSLSVIVGSAPQRIQHNTIGGLAGGTVTMLLGVNGGPYSNMATIPIPGGPITKDGSCVGGPCGVNGVITQVGTLDGTGTNSTNTNTGFPWTTGVMTGIATEDLPVQPSTFTFTGSDNRTDLGLGNITLVSGGLSFRQPANSVFIQASKITMTIAARDNLPSMSPPGLAALATLIVVGAGYAVRRRNK